MSFFSKLFGKRKRIPKVTGNMRTICIFNESVRPEITRAALEEIAHALYRQASEHYAAFCEDSAPSSIVVAMKSSEIPLDAALILLLDVADQESVLGYHYTLPNGQPIAKVFTKPIFENGGSLSKSSNSVSQTISHELLEMLGDPYANFWADMPAPNENTEEALERCDRVEGDSYEIDGIAVSNFLGPRAFRGGVGPYDYMGLLKSPFDLTPGGYAIRRVGGPNGTVSEVYGSHYPQWKQDLKSKLQKTRHAQRKGKKS